MRPNLGLKIYCNPYEDERIQLIRSALPSSNPLEIGFYSMEGVFNVEEWFLEMLEKNFSTYTRRIVHLSTKNTVMRYNKTQTQWQEELLKEISLAKQVGAEYCIIHDSKYPPSIRQEEEFIERLADGAEELMRFSPLPLYMENTFAGTSYYRKLFRALKGRLNFVYDIGHSKVWSNNSFEEWFGLLLELQQLDIKFHFHLHNNNGIFDQHLPFTTLPDPETEAFAIQLLNHFHESSFIFEIARDFIENMERFSQAA